MPGPGTLRRWTPGGALQRRSHYETQRRVRGANARTQLLTRDVEIHVTGDETGMPVLRAADATPLRARARARWLAAWEISETAMKLRRLSYRVGLPFRRMAFSLRWHWWCLRRRFSWR